MIHQNQLKVQYNVYWGRQKIDYHPKNMTYYIQQVHALKIFMTQKIHKLPTNRFIDNLLLSPIISNIGTKSYQLAKYLAKLLSPLAQSNYTINSTKDFTMKIKNEKIPENYEMVSFDLKSLATLVPLEQTTDIIIKRIYKKYEITTVFTKNEMKKKLL